MGVDAFGVRIEMWFQLAEAGDLLDGVDELEGECLVLIEVRVIELGEVEEALPAQETVNVIH